MRRRTGRGELNFSAVCEPLTQIAESTSVPLTCIVLQDGDRTHKKTLLGSTQQSPSNPTPRSGTADTQQTEGIFHLNGVPKRLRGARDGEIDQLGGETLFAVGSLVKQLLALTCSVIIKNNSIRNLKWETRVITWMKELNGHWESLVHLEEEFNPSIRDLFLNHDALPPINLFLFLADGVCQISDEDFISYLSGIVYQSNQRDDSDNGGDNKGGYRYTSANAILIALLLESAMNRPIHEIMKEYLFEPLGMSRTTLNRDKVMEMARDPDENISLGQRLSSDLKTVWPTAAEQPYRHSTVFKMSIGMWSCTNDLAKLYNAICQALDSKPGHITRAMVHDFLNAFGQEGRDGSEGICVAPAGLLYRLKASDQGHESLNYTVRQQSRPGEQRQEGGGTRRGSDLSHFDVVYKGGTCDGFTATAYLHLPTRKFTIVLSNASGPVDITEPIARYMLQAAVNFGAGSHIRSIQDDLRIEIREQLAMALPLWQAIETEDKDVAAWPEDTKRFVGVYQHRDHQLQIDIRGGEAHFRRLRQHGPDELTVMRIGALDNRLRLFPVLPGVFVDRLTFFRDLQMVVRNGGDGKRQLIANGGQDLFIMQ